MPEAPLPCAVCGAHEARPLYRPPKAPGPVVRCAACGLVYVSPRENTASLIFEGPSLGGRAAGLLTSSNLQDIQGTWEMALLRSKEAEWPALRHNARAALARLARWRPAPGRLLDFGCGGGFFLGSAAECGWEIFGLEPLPGHAVYARARFGAQVVSDTLRAHTYPPEYFDVITAFQVFEHLPDPAGTLRALVRLLRPGGLLLIEVPNIETWSVRLLGPRHRHFVPDHLTFFAPQTLARLMTASGLQVVDVYRPARRMTVQHLLGYWGRRTLPRRLARLSIRAAMRAGLWERTLTLNVGDIVAAVGRKAQDGAAA